jgi:hypothetical protein
MAAKVAQGQLRDRLFAVEGARFGHPLLQQCVRELFAASRPAGDQSVQLRAHDEVREALPIGRDAARGQDLAELAPGQVARARERRGEQCFGPSGDLVV